MPLIQALTRAPVAFLPTAADALMLPASAYARERVIDLLCVGRRESSMHAALIEHADARGKLYIYDVWTEMQVREWRAARPSATTPSSWSTMPRHRLHRPRRPRDAPALRGRGPGRHPDQHHRQGVRRPSGGYTAARAEVVELLGQRSRAYLSPTPSPRSSPPHADGARPDRAGPRPPRTARRQCHRAGVREEMTEFGFELAGAGHSIIPVMLGDASLAERFAAAMLDRGVYAIGFSYPVVPKGQARIRTQMSAALTPEDIDAAVAAVATGRELGVIR